MKRVTPELETEIIRLRFAEKWPVGTIATQLELHHSSVRRVLQRAGLPVPQVAPRASKIDPYLPFIRETLDKYPKLTAARLHAMACERGYQGGQSQFREVVRELRPRPKAEAFARLSVLPGEQAQVDWAHFDQIVVEGGTRRLLGFVMTLSYSRRLFLRFFFDARMSSFLRGHVDAFEYFGGVPRQVLYDNLKSAVTERVGTAIRFNPTLLELAKHYRFGPRAAAPARGNEKGRVERAIRYIRQSFFAARTWVDLGTLNAEAQHWCEQVSDRRPWPDARQRTVASVFAEERESLLALPSDHFPAEERLEVRVGKTPYVRFDGNDYSVPPEHVRTELTVLASVYRLRICKGVELVAEHPRSYAKGKRLEQREHVEALLDSKHGARRQRGLGRLQAAAPRSEAFLRRAAERGLNLGSITARLLGLLDEYGASELDEVLAEVNHRELVHVPSVLQLLEQRRSAAGRQLPSPVELPRAELRELVVRPHALSTYDHICEDDDDER
jgi:transposase